MPASPFEYELVQRCCDGNRTAYRELYELYAGELMAIALRYMKSTQEAEDVLQETFIKVFKNLASFDQRSALKTWITRILINTALNMLRSRHQMINWSIDDESVIEYESFSLDNHDVRDLIGFIQELPTGCQMVFNLYVIEGYAHKEIAQMLDISEGTSKSQLHRAKGLLQAIIVSEDTRTKRRAV